MRSVLQTEQFVPQACMEQGLRSYVRMTRVSWPGASRVEFGLRACMQQSYLLHPMLSGRRVQSLLVGSPLESEKLKKLLRLPAMSYS